MPYIPDLSRREQLDQIVQLMEQLGMDYDGELNYVLYNFATKNVPFKYREIKKFKGELNECKDEVQRRLMTQREKLAIEQNGDV